MKKKKNSKVLILILLIIILTILSTTAFGMVCNKFICNNSFLDFASKNEKTIFSVNKCVFFTNCNVKNKTNSSTNYSIENLYQYTDIAIFINNNNDENTLENTLKSVKINNLQFSQTPSLGNPKLFYKNINSFAENMILENNAFENELNFKISSNDNEDLNEPILYNNCANPIVLSYINQNIKSNYTIIDNTSAITYDGSLLKKCNIPLNSLISRFSFDLYITNNLDQEFKSSIVISPPLEYSNKTLYDGAITLTQNTNYNFFRYK